MSEDGYTLVEMLAALAIIGFALSGLLESLNAIRLTQAGAARGVNDAQSLARARRDLGRLFQGQGPFRSDDKAGLTGDAGALAFACGKGRCTARLVADGKDSRMMLAGPEGWTDTAPLPGVAAARFVYVDAKGQIDAWPPVDQHRRMLGSVAVLAGPGGDAAAVASTRMWLDEAPDCQFDPIAEDCRMAGS